MFKMRLGYSSIMTALLVLLSLSLIIVNFACTPPSPQIDSAMEKAQQDSVRQVELKKYQFELAKNFSTGYEYYKNKMYRNAINPFLVVAEIDTINFRKDVWAKLADCYFKLDNPDSVQIVAEKGLEKYPDYLYLHRTVAHIYTGRDMIDEAISHYETVVEVDPKAADDWKKLGNLYVKNDDIDAAIDAFEHATELNAKDQESNDILSKLYAQTGNEDAALDRLKRVREQDPENPKHMFGLGKQYFSREMFAEAEPEFIAYLVKRPEDNIVREYLASSLQNQDKYAKAIEVYKSVLENDSNSKKSLCEIGSCLKNLNRFSEARNYTRKALAIDRSYGYAYIVRGEIYEMNVDYCMTKANRSLNNFDDKLIYRLAYDQFKKAAADPAFRDIAERKMSYVKPMIPTKEDAFLHSGVTKAKAACYRWIY